MPRFLLTSRALRGFLTLFMTAASLALFSQLSVEVEGENISCFGLASGSATATVANGTAPFSFVWSNGGNTMTISNLTAGTYGVTVTDDNGLTDTGAITLTEPSRITATISDPLQCDAPFMIAADAEGGVLPYSYNWSTGADTRAVSVPEGDYCVTVVDANLCGYVACTTVEANPPSVTLVDVDLQCAGDEDGAITANPAGGVAPYTYAWSNGQTTRTITNLAPGVYGVTLTDARGCMASASATISEPPVLTGSISGDNTVCPGVADAFLLIAPSGGAPPYTYNWTPGNFTGQGLGPLPAGSYSVEVTDANGCSITRSFVILTSEEVEVEIEGDEILCGAGATGTLTASPVSGPVSQYVYAWSTGADGPTITNVGPGTYTVTATDENGCTGTATATVTAVDLDLSLSSTPTTCVDENDGTATATATGGQQPYTYEWSNGGNTATITGLAPGVYGVTVTEAGQANCKVSGNVQVGAPQDIVVMATPTNVDCAGANSGSIDVEVSGGITPYSFLWNTGAVTEDLNNIGGGTYSVTVTDANGCTESLVVNVSEPDPIVINEQVTNIACAGDETGRIVLTVSGGTQPYTYAWSNGATTRILNNLDAGTYTVTVTDANGCDLVESYTITEPNPIVLSGVVTDVICAGDSDGAINLNASGGTGTLSFSWSNGATTEDISGLAAGTYTVTVMDTNECIATESFTVNAPDAILLTVTPTNVTCFDGNDGSIDVDVSGGMAPYTVEIDGEDDLVGLSAATYTITVTDANGCKETAQVVIQQPSDFNVTSQVTPVACLGDATGAINLTVSGATPGYTYAWSNGATTQDISGLEAGDYTVTITDANGCTFVATYTVGTNSAITVTGVVTPAQCNGEASGAVNITVSGGSGAYSYQWSNTATTEDLTNVGAGTYTVTVMDANECDAVASFVVTEPDEIDLTVTNPTITCGGTETGSITVFPNGGTAPFTYLWSNGDTGMTISNIGAGSYTVTVTDANGCTDVTAGIILNEIPELTCDIVVNQQPTEGDNGSVSVEVDGGTIPYTYVWDDNSTNPDRNGLSAGTYSVTVTDANNCTTECSVTLQGFAGIGDFVWIDLDLDGMQDPDEPGLNDYPVYLKNEAGMIIDSTRTDENGFYSFMGLNPGTYSILFIEPEGGDRTLFNIGNDASDNDADPAMGGMTQQYTLVEGEFNMTVDAGFIQGTDGPIVDPCLCLNNNTTEFDGQFSERFEIIAGAGQTWVITAQTNMYDLNDGTVPPMVPALVPIGTELEVLGEVDPDPVFGPRFKYGLDIRLIDSLPYTVTASNGIQEFTVSNQCFYPVVRYVDTPPDTICQFDPVILIEGFGLLNGDDLPGTVVFTLDGEEVTEIDPALLPVGGYEIIAEFFPDPPVDEDGLDYCIPNLARELFVIDECPAKLGDFVWFDANGNGIQDPGEDGIEGVKVTVTSEDGTYMDMTLTDDTGMYMFSVPPGTYKITFELPEGLIPTGSNAGNDELDSDMNPSTLMTPFYTVGPNEMDFSIDAGFLDPCISNVSNPGTIAASQELCGPGNVPEPLVEIAPASGGQGQIEYLWMSNTEDSGQDISYWQPIPNSNSPNFAPGPVFETTFFVRCVRRNNCPYIEGNVLTIEVGDDAVAAISAPSSACVGEEVIFQAVNPGTSNVTWNFSGSSTVESATGASVATTWQTFGAFSATLTVVRNGCTSTVTKNISIVNNPSRCGGNLTASGTVNSLQARDVEIEWQLPADGSEQAFELERSTDGQNFSMVAEVNTPMFTSGSGMNVYRQSDISPLAGRTFYRVRMLDEEYGDMISNVVEMQLGEETTALGRIFPNPANNGMIHVEMTDEAQEDLNVSVQLYDVRGNTVGARRYLRPGSGVINLDATGQAAGLYILRMMVGDRTETHRVILE